MFQPDRIATNMQTLLSGNSHKPIELSMASIVPKKVSVGAKASCTSDSLNASYDRVFALTHTARLFLLPTRICLEYAIYNGKNQSLWLYMIIYDLNLGLTIAVVDWQQQDCFEGSIEELSAYKGAGAS